MARSYLVAVALLGCAAAALAAPNFVIPNMQKLREVDSAALAAQMESARASWRISASGPSECFAAQSPCQGNLLTSWWARADAPQRAYLMMALAKDAYPKPENLGVSGDGPEYECKLAAKWKALGAQKVRFVNTPLTNIVLLKAGANVFINYRGTWTDTQEANNRNEWIKVAGPLAGSVHGGWLRSLHESWDDVMRVLTSDFRCNGQCAIVLTGHSRGGGLAMLAASSLPAGIGSVAQVFTWGGVRPGSRDFQDAFNERFGAVTFNYWNKLDWVPRQPFINAQAPRLRLTEATCPSKALGESLDNCYTLVATNSRGRARDVEMCSKGSPTPEGTQAHNERQYLASLLACARPQGLSTACIAAL